MSRKRPMQRKGIGSNGKANGERATKRPGGAPPPGHVPGYVPLTMHTLKAEKR